MKAFNFSEGVTKLEDGLDFLEGFNPAVRQANSLREIRVHEASQLWLDVIEGGQDPYLLRQAFNPTSPVAWEILCRRYPAVFSETMTTSDFTALTADVLDRLLLANYSETPMHWTSVAKKSTLRDFRSVKRFVINGAESEYQKVLEDEGPQYKSTTQPAPYTYAPDVYAGAARISWRAVINDDLGIFRDLPARLARGARRTIEKFVTRLYVDANGPDATFFTGGHANLISGNPVLSVAGLAAALKLMFKQVDSDGEPIEVEGLSLVVGPHLYVTAMNIMNQIVIDMTEAGGTSNQRVRVNNWIIQGMSVVKNPQIPLIASSSNGDTTWFLFANPNTGRPALEVGFLQGFDSPQLFQKMGNTMRIGGGIDQTMGDWSTMATEYKGVLVHGGCTVDPKMAVASNGSGS